ncbi:uncharacterized protein LOC110047860 isoform X1 [Orbicella faveolata]|uniref:uncharacterized protein LOC110047860 isoform X1 n=1 Tax=Orbicella faveolata TaxID=48498 RepID=UPI0009E29073|nr:uncharacterized protein LOC110047860 isoform X1 [Orbicella faveolata]
MLLLWRDTTSLNALYRDLYHALCSDRVGLDNVAKEFCYVSGKGPSLPKRPKFEDSPTKQFLVSCLEELHEFYNTNSKVKITPWDQDNTVDIDKIYIQLSIVRDDRKPDETAKEKLQDYAEMFKGYGGRLNSKRILVYGRPGIGKSTFTQKIAVDWTRGKKEILKKFDVLLLIKLRDVCDSQDFRTMLETAELLSADDPVAVDNLDKYVRENQGKVLLVFDGYDEYSGGKSSPVDKIWRGSLLRGCCVVITTRRVKEEELSKQSHVQLELNGFDSEEQVKEFASKFLSDQKNVEELVEYLRKQQHLWDMAKIPLLLLMLCLVWKEKDRKGLPASGADLYSRFMQTLLYHMKSKDSEEEFQSIDEYKEELSRLGELAFYALLENCLHFSFSKLPDSDVFKKFIDAAFLQTSNLSSSIPEKIVYFLHKSVQEFVAARFIVRELTNKKNESVTCLSKIDSFQKIEEMFEVLKFACELSSDAARAVLSHLQMIGDKEGLTAYNFTVTPSVEDLSNDQRRFISISSDCLFSCAASDRQAVFPFFLECVNYVLILNGEQVSIAAREHLLRSTSSCPNYLFFDQGLRSKEIDDDEVFSVLLDLNTSLVLCSGEVRSVKKYPSLADESFFLKKEGQQMLFCLTRICKDYTHALPTELLIELTSTPVSPSQQPVDDLSKNQDNSGALVLTENVPDHTGQHSLSFVREIEIYDPTSEELAIVKNVLPFITHPHDIEIACLFFTSYDAGLIESVVSNIHLSDNLHSLKLVNINLTATCADEIASSLYQAGNLRKLDLSGSPLYSNVRSLVENLGHVTVLRLRRVNMGEEEAAVLGASLARINGLQKLDISDNELGHGIIKLANHLDCAPSLTKLNLGNTKMGAEEAKAVFRCLPRITLLQNLNLSFNPLGYGIMELAKNLNFVPGLRQLWLRDTQIGEEEVSALACALKDVPELVDLDVSLNPIGRGVSVLIQHLSSVPELNFLYLDGVEMTKSEAEELCTACRRYTTLSTEYHELENINSHRLRTEAELEQRGYAFADE